MFVHSAHKLTARVNVGGKLTLEHYAPRNMLNWHHKQSWKTDKCSARRNLNTQRRLLCGALRLEASRFPAVSVSELSFGTFDDRFLIAVIKRPNRVKRFTRLHLGRTATHTLALSVQ